VTQPPVGSVALEMYPSIPGPWRVGDEARGWATLHLCQAIGLQQQVVHDIAIDTEDGHVAWSVLLNVERCPDWALPWLAQFRGVRIPRWVTDVEAQRDWIRDVDGQRRGRPASLAAAVASTLTGAKTVVVRERYHNGVDPTAAWITVRTRTSETPDAARTAAVAEEAKLGGLLLDYSAVAGADYQQHTDQYATYALRSAAFATYAAATADPLQET
jgi:hypothetical protein